MHNLPLVHASARRYQLQPTQFVAAMEAALPLAARVGSGFTQEHLDEIVRAGEIPLDSPLLASPTTIYLEALRYAHVCIWPRPVSGNEAPEDLTPANAVRKLVRDTYARFEDYPDAVRLIASENIFGQGDVSSLVTALKDSPVVLHVDRVLMHGHDIGAFREGVSAEDVYILIASMCSFAITQGRTFYALYGMNAFDEANSRGLVELTCDAVLAFLTTTMPTDQGTSYTHSSHSAAVGSSVAASLYSTDHAALPPHRTDDEQPGWGDAAASPHHGASDLYDY